MNDIQISPVYPGSAEVAICAQWRIDAFSMLGSSVEAERRSLEAFVADRTRQVALIARCDGALAGTCLLVPSEIDPLHDVSPWLAGLYVVPDFRRRGIAHRLVRAIEAEALIRDHARLYLYTDDAVGLYERLGWRVMDRVDWMGFPTALMMRDFKEPPPATSAVSSPRQAPQPP